MSAELIWNEERISVWRFELDIWSDLLNVYRWHRISDVEFARADSFTNQKLKSRFIGRRGILRELLSGYLTCDDKAIDIQVGEFGKPFVVGYPIHFSTSQSGDLGLVGISTQAEIGVDIQVIETRLVNLDFEYFTHAERECVKASSSPSLEFFRIWTRKEACIKAVGKGLHVDLSTIDVLSDFVEMPEPIHIRNIDVGSSYSAAIAIVLA